MSDLISFLAGAVWVLIISAHAHAPEGKGLDDGYFLLLVIGIPLLRVWAVIHARART